MDKSSYGSFKSWIFDRYNKNFFGGFPYYLKYSMYFIAFTGGYLIFESYKYNSNLDKVENLIQDRILEYNIKKEWLDYLKNLETKKLD